MRKLVSRNSLGEALHVALRKACDSKPTSLLYVLVSALPNSIWAEFCGVVWKGLKAQKTTEVQAAGCLRKAALAYDPFTFTRPERDSLSKVTKSLPESETAGRTDDDIRSERDRWRKLLKLALEMLEDDDWHGFAAYLVQ